MARKEFSKSVKVAALKRAMVNGIIRCEECHCEAKRPEIHHVNPDALTGEPTLENAMVLCRDCHREKTSAQAPIIAKAKRREARQLGIRKRPQLKSAGFPKFEKPSRIGKHRIEKLPLPPRRGI